MRSFFMMLCLLSSVALAADPPKFSTGGFLVGLQPGAGFWHLGPDDIAAQVQSSPYATGQANDAAAIANNAHDTFAMGIQLAYNILGHASVGIDFAGSGWNLADPSRGGAGFLAGTVGWHPMELIFMNKEQRPIPLDFFTFVGVGYGIVGGGSGPHSVAMDGLFVEWGLDADYYFTRYLGVGLFAHCNFLKYGTYYWDWDGGVKAPLPNSSGGTWWHTGLTLRLRIGD